MSISRFFLYASFLCLIACGSDDDDGGGGNGFDLPEDTAQPVEYEGNTDAAALNTTNVGDFIYKVLPQTRNASYLDRIEDFPDFNVTALSASAGAGDAGFSIAAVSDSYDEAKQDSRDCESGRVDNYLLLNNTGPNFNQSGKYVLDFRNCLEEGVVTDGLLTHDIDSYEPSDGVIQKSTIRFNRMTFNANGVDFVRSGTLGYEADNLGEYETHKVNIVYTRTDTGAMYWRRNMTYEWNESAVAASYGELISGRFYDGVHGYVEVTTPQVIQFNGTDGGKLMLAGADNSAALLEFMGTSGYVANLGLDADGDGTYETTAVVDIRLLGTGVNADIGDDDGDGVHNSWETYYGLDPQNPGDATLDPDGDSMSNLDEYLDGASPLELPLHPDIAVAWDSQTDGNFVAGTQHALFFRIENIGTSVGSGFVEFTLPPEFGLLSVSPPPPYSSDISCEIAGNTVTCDLESMQDDTAGTVRINVMLPVMTGTYNYEATATVTISVWPDFDQSNNVLNGQIEVTP